MELSVDNRCFMSRRLGYSRVKLTLIVKLNAEVFSKGIEGRVKTTGGHQLLNRVRCWKLAVLVTLDATRAYFVGGNLVPKNLAEAACFF